MNQPPPIPFVRSSQALADSKTSLVAIWSLVFGVLSFFLWVVGAILALILGVIALVQISGSQERLQGKGLAIAGLVTGGVGLIVGLILVGIAMPLFEEIQGDYKANKQAVELRDLAKHCLEYASDNQSQLPRALEDLYPDYVDNKKMLQTYNELAEQTEPYTYFAGGVLHNPISVMIVAPMDEKGLRAVGFSDGRVERMPEAEYQHLLQQKQPQGQSGEQMKTVKQLVLACYTYASEHKGVFPETLHQLFPVYLDDVSLLVAGAEENGTSVGYLYFPGLSNTSHSKALLVASPFVFEGTRVVGFVGGHVREVADEKYQQLVKAQQKFQ